MYSLKLITFKLFEQRGTGKAFSEDNF